MCKIACSRNHLVVSWCVVEFRATPPRESPSNRTSRSARSCRRLFPPRYPPSHRYDVPISSTCGDSCPHAQRVHPPKGWLVIPSKTASDSYCGDRRRTTLSSSGVSVRTDQRWTVTNHILHRSSAGLLTPAIGHNCTTQPLCCDGLDRLVASDGHHVSRLLTAATG